MMDSTHCLLSTYQLWLFQADPGAVIGGVDASAHGGPTSAKQGHT